VPNVVNHDPADVVVLGLGVMGGAIAAELSVAGHSVVGIEKGPYWDYSKDWQPVNKENEWGVLVERRWDHPLALSTFTVRNNKNQFATPVRRYNKNGQIIAMGHGVGGMATHFAAAMGRFGPWAYQALTRITNQQGTSVLPANHTIEDWPVTYDDMRPYYDAWEKMMGISGDTQDPFTPGAKFPLPPHPFTPVAGIFKTATDSLGYHAHSAVSAITSQSYVNQYGIPRNACVYDGYCAAACNYACEVGAKSSSHVTTVPAAMASGHFDMRLNSFVFRIDLDSTGKKATGVRYYDADGTVHVQPGKAIFNGIWGFNLIRLMLLSGIGRPYDPVTGQGTLGRSLATTGGPPASNATGVLNIGGNAYPAGSGSGGGYQMQDFADDNFDHKGLNFVGGANIAAGGYLGSGPGLITSVLPGPANFGSTYKASLKDVKLPNKIRLTISPTGPDIPTTEKFADLDPHYVDTYGDPLARITKDWDANVTNAADYLAPIAGNILTKMGATNVTVNKGASPGTVHIDSFLAHERGGATTGTNPATSVWNKWMQNWDVENVFASGEICETFGDNTTAGTHPAGAMSYLAADGMKKYLASPGPLV
jgi:gluconate 2-dehydrogenase alpha chain